MTIYLQCHSGADFSDYAVSKFFSCYSADVYNGIHCEIHCVDGAEFVWAVEVEASCEKIRARKTFERELRSVRTASDGFYGWFAAGFFYGFLCNIYYVHHRLNLFAHVVVLILDVGFGYFFTVLLIYLIYDFCNSAFAFFKQFSAVVAYDVGE